MKTTIRILFAFLISFVLSCHCKMDNNKFVLVEKYNDKYLKDSIKYPPYDYYVGNNIILPEKSGQIFYHNSRSDCGTGWRVSNPPRPIDFENNPLLQFNSVHEFSKFLMNFTLAPRLVIFVSDSDTIRNTNYFDLIDTLHKLGGTYVVARRKITNDEFDAIMNSRWIPINMKVRCELDDLSEIKQKWIANENYEDQLNKLFELSENNCQYYPDFELQFQELTYQFIIKSPIKYLNRCDSINENKKKNISHALKSAISVEDSVVLQAYHSLRPAMNNSKKWVSENIEKRLKLILN